MGPLGNPSQGESRNTFFFKLRRDTNFPSTDHVQEITLFDLPLWSTGHHASTTKGTHSICCLIVNIISKFVNIISKLGTSQERKEREVRATQATRVQDLVATKDTIMQEVRFKISTPD